MGAFTVQRDGDVAVVVFDLPGESVNKFSAAVKDEFAALTPVLRDDGGVVYLNGTEISRSLMRAEGPLARFAKRSHNSFSAH